MTTEPASEPVVLSVEDLFVSYGRRTALDHVSLRVPKGSVYALLGKNGAGKSSLVRCALGQQKPRAGSVRLFGDDSWAGRERLMSRVGVVPEEPDAPPTMTAAALVAFTRSLYPRADVEGMRTRLSRAGVPPAIPFGRLSKGQKGAVMLTLALGHSPELLVLDDPTLGLDVLARRTLYDELIGDLADRGTTVLLTTHDLTGVESLADRVGILNGAHLAVDEPLDSLKARFRRVRCGRQASPAGFSPFATVSESRREWGAEAVVSNFDDERMDQFKAANGGVDVEVGTLSLEEIFLALLGDKEPRS